MVIFQCGEVFLQAEHNVIDIHIDNMVYFCVVFGVLSV